MRSAVVIPTNRPERAREFCIAWETQFNLPDVRVIVVEDAEIYTAALPSWVEQYCHLDFGRSLGASAECIPIRSGGCRDFGFWLAYQDATIDMVVSLDDDVLPIDGVDFLAEHWKQLETPRLTRWFPLVPGFHLRGDPRTQEGVKPMLNVGLWQGYPDVDAFTQLQEPDCDKRFATFKMRESDLIPKGMYAAHCGMNLAYRREAVPFAYFPKMPDGMKRWDDIWAGYIFKRVADLHGWAVTCGSPPLLHNRASNPISNLKQEMMGYGINETLWSELAVIVQSDEWTSGPLETYKAITKRLGVHFPQLASTGRLMGMWADLF